MVKRNKTYHGTRRVRRRIMRRRKRSFKGRAFRILASGLEVKRRVFNFQITNGAPTERWIFNPLYWMSQGTSDQSITGNSMLVNTMMLRGHISTYPDLLNYAGPLSVVFYLVWSREEYATTAASEAWDRQTTAVNNWFIGSNKNTSWFVNNSKIKVLKRKKMILAPNLDNAFNSSGTDSARSGRCWPFFLKKKINRRFHFKETQSGGIDGNYGKSGNYYWVITIDNPLEYTNINCRIQMTHMVTFKDI